jgi:hypothetical protein
VTAAIFCNKAIRPPFDTLPGVGSGRSGSLWLIASHDLAFEAGAVVVPDERP